MSGDRNFDDLAHRFSSNVYQTLKGQIRLAVLERDLQQFCPELETPGMAVLDAGCGRAPFAKQLLSAGHSVDLVDVSVEMLKLALSDLTDSSLEDGNVRWFHGSALQYQQQYQQQDQQHYDLILCHAVLEWVEDPQTLLRGLYAMLKPGGKLSLLFYNVDGLVFKNLLRTNFKKVQQGNHRGSRRSLTPRYPRKIAEVNQWCQTLSLHRLCHSGIRVFHDYIFNEPDRTRQPEELKALELELSVQSPYRELGRYQHMIWQKD